MAISVPPPAVPTSLPFTCLVLLEYLDARHRHRRCRHRATIFRDLLCTHPMPGAGTVNLTSGNFQWGGREGKRKTLPSSLGFTWSSTSLPGPYYMLFQLFINLHLRLPSVLPHAQAFSSNGGCIPLTILFLPNYITYWMPTFPISLDVPVVIAS